MRTEGKKKKQHKNNPKHLLWSMNKRSWIVLLLFYECVLLLCFFYGTWMSAVVVKTLTRKAEAEREFNEEF